MLCEGPKSARDCEQISKLLVEKRLTNANSDAPSEVHQLSVATCQPAAGRESTLGPLGHLSTKFDRYDVRMHSSGCWNDAPTRRASGRDLRPATPTAGSVSFLTLAARAAATIKAHAWGE